MVYVMKEVYECECLSHKTCCDKKIHFRYVLISYIESIKMRKQKNS